MDEGSVTFAGTGQPVIRPIQGPERRPQPARPAAGPVIRPIQGPERRPQPMRRTAGPAIRPILGPEREPLPARPLAVPVAAAWTPLNRQAPAETPHPIFTSEPAPERYERSGRRVRPTVVAIVSILLLMTVGLTGAWAVQRHLDSPVRESFEAANASFERATDQLAAADSVAEVSVAAETYGKTLPLLDEAATQAETRDSEVAYAARRTVQDQLAVAEAASALIALTPTDISPWGAARGPLADSISALTDREKDSGVLGVEDGTLPTVDLVDHVHNVVGEAAAVTAGQQLERFFATMTESELTADLSQVGKQADRALLRMDPAVELKRGEIVAASNESPRQVDLYAQTLAALRGMAPLKPGALEEWDDMRAGLGRAAEALAGDPLDRQANTATLAADALVTKAQASLDRWERAFARAQEEKAQAIEALTAYDTAMQPQLTEYAGLRTALGDLKQRVGTPGSQVSRAQVSGSLSNAQERRRTVRDTIAGLSAPEGTVAAHRDLLRAINDDIAELGTASRQVAKARVCRRGCTVGETLAWQRFTAASARINAALDAAVAGWEQALTVAREAAQNAPLPKKPVV